MCRIHRLDDAPGCHDRCRSSVQRHMDNAPAPIPLKKGKRYPKVHKNQEKHYKTKATLYEYPTMDFPTRIKIIKVEAAEPAPAGLSDG